MAKRKHYSAEFKAKIAQAAISEELTAAEQANMFGPGILISTPNGQAPLPGKQLPRICIRIEHKGQLSAQLLSIII